MLLLLRQLEHTKEGLIMNEKWSEKTKFQKVMDIISGIALLVYVIFQTLESAGKVESAELATCIAIVVVCVCEGFSYWNTKRIFSYIAIAGAIFLTTVLILLNI